MYRGLPGLAPHPIRIAQTLDATAPQRRNAIPGRRPQYRNTAHASAPAERHNALCRQILAEP